LSPRAGWVESCQDPWTSLIYMISAAELGAISRHAARRVCMGCKWFTGKWTFAKECPWGLSVREGGKFRRAQRVNFNQSLVDGQQQTKFLARQAPVGVLVKDPHRCVTVVLHVFQRHFLDADHRQTTRQSNSAKVASNSTRQWCTLANWSDTTFQWVK